MDEMIVGVGRDDETADSVTESLEEENSRLKYENKALNAAVSLLRQQIEDLRAQLMITFMK